MKKLFFGAASLLIVFSLLAGCASMGRGHGPVEAFLIPAAANPGLPGDLVGTLNLFADPKEITLVVAPGTNLHALVARVALNTEATITVVSSGARVVQQNGSTPNDFSAPVLYSIEVPGQKEPWRYRVTVREMETNTRLAQIVLPQGARFLQKLDPAVRDYRAEVPYASTVVRVEARAQSRFAKSVTVDGKETPGTVGRADVDFSSFQEKPVTIQVLAEDGVTRDTYTLTIVRGAPDSNALLASLDVQGVPISPAFNPAQLGYQVIVPFETQNFVVRARPQSPFATVGLAAAVRIGGGRAQAAPFSASGDATAAAGAVVDFSQAAGLPLIVAVTAQDGTVQQYLVEVRRGPPDANNLLADLSLDVGGVGIALSPDFAPNRVQYVALVPFTAGQVRVAAHPQSRVAALQLGGGLSAAGGKWVLSARGNPVSQEGAVVDVPPRVQRMPLFVMVTAQNGAMLQYGVELRRAAPEPQVLQPQQPAQQPAQAAQPQQPAQQPAQVAQPQQPAQQQAQPPAAAAQPAPAPATQQPAQPPAAVAGNDHVVVIARNLQLEDKELAAMIGGKDLPGKTAMITVRPYRSAEILRKDSTPVDMRVQGRKLSLSLQYRSAGVNLGRDRLIEIEVAIPTTAGKILYYKEAMPAADEASLTVPFLLYTAAIPWPAIGSPTPVSGYVSLAKGGARPEDREAFQKNGRGEYGIDIEITDAKTGKSYGKDTVWRKPGLARGQAVSFTTALTVPEGSTIGYTMTARAANGRTWVAAGQAQVWTTRLRADGGFEPVLLPLADDLALKQ